MKGSTIRRAYLDYFRSKGHTEVASSSLVPQNDPTLLFSNAGMNQFKDCFLGAEKRAYTRATTCQKCLRISGKHNDFENVGFTARHHTFFEMLGNFSFGDYFKSDAISYAWEFSTRVLNLPESRLWITIFENDDEAHKLWREISGLPDDRIIRMGEADNFWAMGDTGPCGPCSELHYYRGKDAAAASAKEFLSGSTDYLEYWNLVFMQFERGAGGKLTPLPRPSIDTGMGLERMTQIVQGTVSNYDTDLLRDIITVCESLSGFRYDGRSFAERDLKKDLEYARDVAMRVIADHSRSAAFLVAEGVHPASDGRGYVLRRIIRRAARHARVLNLKEPFFAKTAQAVIETMGDAYPELRQRSDIIKRVLDAEERKFQETLESGMEILQREVERLPSGSQFPGKTAFLLHDTYGFPLDLTEDALRAYNVKVDSAGFEQAMAGQKERSREDRKSHGIAYSAVKIDAPRTEFLGYETLAAEAKLLAVVPPADPRSNRMQLVFSATPFYAESGGQVGDTGTVALQGITARVVDTQKAQDGLILHEIEIDQGAMIDPRMVGSAASLAVDAERRSRIRANHTATHLVHAALRKFVGSHATQAGSRVDDRSLRFDYSHFETLTPETLSEMQDFVNSQIRANHEVQIRTMSIDEAKKLGAMALFGEKYGNEVRVVQVGPESLELCGGTHVTRSGDIGVLLINYDTGISAGVRRIECWAGAGAAEEIAEERNERRKVLELLKGGGEGVAGRVERLLERVSELEREAAQLKAKLAGASASGLISAVKVSPKGIKVIAERVDDADSDTLRTMVDRLRLQIGSGVVALAARQGGGGPATIVAGVTADLTGAINAGTLVREAAKVAGGKGGGRADFAQAGGVDPAKLEESLKKIIDLVQ